jgi:hypothetical protein
LATPTINFPQTTCETNIDTTTCTLTDHLQSAVCSAAIKPKKKLSKKRCPGGYRNSGLLGISLEEAKATFFPHSTQ